MSLPSSPQPEAPLDLGALSKLKRRDYKDVETCELDFNRLSLDQPRATTLQQIATCSTDHAFLVADALTGFR
jgi:hypothetical protein